MYLPSGGDKFSFDKYFELELFIFQVVRDSRLSRKPTYRPHSPTQRRALATNPRPSRPKVGYQAKFLSLDSGQSGMALLFFCRLESGIAWTSLFLAWARLYFFFFSQTGAAGLHFVTGESRWISFFHSSPV